MGSYRRVDYVKRNLSDPQSKHEGTFSTFLHASRERYTLELNLLDNIM